MPKFFSCWLPLIAYCLLIFVQSSLPVSEDLPTWPLSDKLLHLGGYALLGILFYRALSTLSWAAQGRRQIWAAIIATGLYGISDELHQGFVASRTADSLDALMDILGGALGVMILHAGQAWLARRTPKVAALTSPPGSDNKM
ncbi:MAG: VanZ family protein [Desulfobacterales bacterium]